MSLLFISLTLLISAAFTTTHSLTIDLIHRDSHRFSPKSSLTHSDKLYSSFRRSISRARHFRSPSSISGTNLIPTGGSYVIQLSIGTPPTPFIGIADTAYSLMWTQCTPCTNCYDQETPIYNPADSSTFQTMPCSSEACSQLPVAGQSCTTYDNTCAYRYGYRDGSSTAGELASETLTLDSVSISDVVFGCGHANQGTFQSPGTGLIGLGQGPLSLPSQTKDPEGFGGKFAYCLAPFGDDDVSSKISFGENAVVSGRGVVSTPVATGKEEAFYYLTLEGVSVGDERVAFKNRVGSGRNAGVEKGNIVIDLGTTLTFLPNAMFEEVSTKLKKLIGLKPVADPQGTLELCYSGEFEVPKMAFHFSGATLDLGSENSFIRIQENLVCFSMLPAGDFALFGNLAQINFIVGHDLDAKTVSFKAADCTKYV